MEIEPEGSPRAAPPRRSRFKIGSLMTWVALVAVGLGWVLYTARTRRASQVDKARFNAWAADFEAVHPTLKPLGRSMTSTWNFFELDQRWHQDYQTPKGQSISIQGVVRTGPLRRDRWLTFESPGLVVTWPFEDVERGRKVDLVIDFPGLSR